MVGEAHREDAGGSVLEVEGELVVEEVSQEEAAEALHLGVEVVLEAVSPVEEVEIFVCFSTYMSAFRI